MSARVRFLIAALVLACCVAPGAAQRAPKPVVHRILIDATSFSETALTIRTGDTVEWVNKDVIPHTATATGKGGFDSGVIPAGRSWRHTFDKAGRLPYACSFHPTMKATLRVRSGAGSQGPWDGGSARPPLPRSWHADDTGGQ